MTARSSRSLFGAVRTHITESIRALNLFSEDPIWSATLTNAEQITSTRLFLVLCSISLLLVIAYSSLIRKTHDVTLQRFSIDDFERLENRYPHTISTVCSEVSIPYHKFLSLSPRFHQVCSSPFISIEWITSLFLFNATSHNILDYRTFGFAQYRALRLLCLVSRQSVRDTHHAFNSTHLVNRQVFSRDQFNAIASVLFDNMQQNILVGEKRTANITSMMTAHNLLWSALQTNYYVRSKAGSGRFTGINRIYLRHTPTGDVPCDCRISGNQCTYPAGAFYNWTSFELGAPARSSPPPRFEIPGLMAGCLPLDSMRQSTLECLYNQTCVDLIALQPAIYQPTALNLSFTRFSLNSTIGSIFDESLFLESWGNQSNYEKYYAACAPQSLSYSYRGRFHIGTILTLTLSAFSGLVTAWKLITPILIKSLHAIKWRREPTPTPIKQAVSSHLHRTVRNFNLFISSKKDDEEEERIGIVSTRLYILLMCTGLVILGFYTSLSEQNQIKTVEHPSMSEFAQLNLEHPSTLNCPCSRFSMSFNRIITLSTRSHSVCSSEFLEEHWLFYFSRTEINFTSTDFRVSGLAFFHLIRSLCQAANETIKHARTVFGTNRLVTMSTLPQEQFDIAMQTRLKVFQQRTLSSFVLLVQLIRSAIQTNQLAEGLSTNLAPLPVYNNDTSTWSLRFRSRDFYANACSCLLSAKCIRPAGFHFQGMTNFRAAPNITVPGLVLGCHAIDSVFLSTLECFHDQKCVKSLIENYYFDVAGLIQPLNDRATRIQALSDEHSRFTPNATINEIFSQLFVEEWLNSSNYTSYYTRCDPLRCTYSVRKRFHMAYMLAMMLGFYGGLSAMLDIVLPPMVKLVRRRWSKDSTRGSCLPSCESFLRWFRNICRRIWTLNLFGTDSSSTEKELIATRIYVVLLLISITIAVLYAGPLSGQRKIIEIVDPSIDSIDDLYQRNLTSLSCSCSKVTTRYSQFLSIQPEFHSICSREFISPEYRWTLFQNNNSNISAELITHYRILASLCYRSEQHIRNSIDAFDNRELVTVEPLTKSAFETQIQSLIAQFVRQVKSDYQRTVFLVMSSFGANQLLHLYAKNWKIDFTNESENHVFRAVPVRFSSSNCTCAISSNCSERLIDDIRVGCFPYDGFRLSTFENTSLGRLNKRLFVQKWVNQTNYTDYLQACQPRQCQYLVADRNNLLLMFTTALGLYGGLTYFLHFTVSQMLLAYRWWTRKERPEVVLASGCG